MLQIAILSHSKSLQGKFFHYNSDTFIYIVTDLDCGQISLS